MSTFYGIFYNGQAGSGEAATVAHQVTKALATRGIKSQLLTAMGIPRAIAAIKQVASQLTHLIVIGGDGTLNVALTALIQADAHHITLAVIPTGTVNNFATRYHLPTDSEAAIELICQNATTRKVGIIICNQQRAVVSSLTFGNLAAIANDVRQSEKRRFGKLAYAYQAMRHVGRNRSLPIRYQLDEQSEQILKTWFALITTTKSIGGHVYRDSATGKMTLSLLNNIGWRQVIPYIWFALTGNLQNSKSIKHFDIKKLRLTSPTGQVITTRIDGDQGDKLPLELEYVAERFDLIVPLNSED